MRWKSAPILRITHIRWPKITVNLAIFSLKFSWNFTQISMRFTLNSFKFYSNIVLKYERVFPKIPKTSTNFIQIFFKNFYKFSKLFLFQNDWNFIQTVNKLYIKFPEIVNIIYSYFTQYQNGQKFLGSTIFKNFS